MFYIVDTRDKVAQAVHADAPASNDPRFIKVQAESARAAFVAASLGLMAAGEFERARALANPT